MAPAPGVLIRTPVQTVEHQNLEFGEKVKIGHCNVQTAKLVINLERRVRRSRRSVGGFSI